MVSHGPILKIGRERGRSEEQAVKEAAGVKEADLSTIERRAFEMVTRKHGFTRTNPKDRARARPIRRTSGKRGGRRQGSRPEHDRASRVRDGHEKTWFHTDQS